MNLPTNLRRRGLSRHNEIKTKLSSRMVFPSLEAREDVVRNYGAIEGGNQTLDRLAEHLTGARTQLAT
jgi:hypothetical protein